MSLTVCGTGRIFIYMRMTGGPYEGYFAWSVNPNGIKRSDSPAPDGEEYFALALLFASNRWGDGDSPFDYSVQAKALLALDWHYKFQ